MWSLLLVTLIWFFLIVGFLYLVYQQYTAYSQVKDIQYLPLEKLPFVSILIPARNEEKNIGNCTKSLLNLNYPKNKYEIIIINDHSEDRTVEIVQALAKGNKNLKLVHADKLPLGWFGKPHACYCGVKFAKGEWLCFIDADTISSPDLLLKTISYTIENKADTLSLSPNQNMGSFWERVILPAEFFLYGMTVDFGIINERKSRPVLNGQFILMKRESYNKVGGHTAVKDEATEDVAFAHLLVNKGFRIAFIKGDSLLSVRMYSGFKSAFAGLSRIKLDVFGSVVRTVLGSLIAFLMVFGAIVLPIWSFVNFVETGTLFALSNLLFAVILLGSIIIFAAFLTTTRYFQIPLVYGFLFPVGYILGVAIMLNSLFQAFFGFVEWKGRRYKITK